MRFKVKMKVEGRSRKFPVNYQYELMSAIYSIMSKADQDYANRLHQKGYVSTNKNFKLFNFSNLIAPNKGIRFDKSTERLVVESNFVFWHISFMLEEGLQKFVQGVFSNQLIHIADKSGGIDFRIDEIQLLPEDKWENAPIECRCLSPICVSRKIEGKSTVAYLCPAEEGYETALLSGLLEKYKAIHGKDYEGERYCRLSNVEEKPKSKLITIKADTQQQTRVKGFVYRFKIELPEELFYIAMNCGIGEKCSMGFGMIERR